MPRKVVRIRQKVERLSILGPDGRVDPRLDPKPDDETLRTLLTAMLRARRFDERLVRLQRTGKIGTYPPLKGQEAAQIGTVSVLRDDDWVVPTYREMGVQLWRGWPMEQIIAYRSGWQEANRVPDGLNDLPPSVVVGSQPLHAVGIAYALRMRRADSVALTYFGDGASSQGDVMEALNFAGVWRAPVVFVCMNNQWAISMPRARQTASQTIAQKAVAFGFDGIQVDGNDLLAVRLATEEAVRRARDGGGPTLIEAVTYRLEGHTTVDDPRKYRSEEELREWRRRDPIDRVVRYARSRGAIDDGWLERTEARIAHEIAEAIERAERLIADANVLRVFDCLYATLPAELVAQRAELEAALARKRSPAPARAGGNGWP